MQHSVPYISQQTGVAERKSRSLKEMVACVLEVRYIPPYMWAEAVNYSLYIQNKVPHNSVIGFTPFEEFMGNKPNVSYLRVFGSKAWDTILIDKRKSFQY